MAKILEQVFQNTNFKEKMKKDKVIIMRITAIEKVLVKKTASSLGLSMTEYFNRLHALAVAELNKD